MKSKKEIIKLSEIVKEYITGEVVTRVLSGISITINQGDFVAITGPSGSGKSTLMNIIGLLDTPTTGKYILNGSDVTGLSEDELSFMREPRNRLCFSILQFATPCIGAGKCHSPGNLRRRK